MNIRRILVALLFAAALFTGAAPAAQTLVYSDHEPSGGMRTRFLNEVFFAEIEKESKGRLKIEAHWNGELSRSYDALRNVGKAGAVDLAVVVPEYTAAELPLHQIFKSYPVGPSGDGQVAFFRRVAAEIPELGKELEKEDAVAIFFATGYPVAFFSTKPLPTLEGVKGGKWRSASFWHRDFLINAGAVPVTMPWGAEVAKAMQAGKLDGLMVNVDSGFEIQAHQVAPQVLLSKELWLGHVYIVAMNRKVWNGLPQEDRDAIHRAAGTAYRSLGSAMEDGFNAMVEEMRQDGADIRLLSPDEVKRWAAVTRFREAQAAWAKEQEGKGVKDVARVMEKIAAIHQDAMPK